MASSIEPKEVDNEEKKKEEFNDVVSFKSIQSIKAFVKYLLRAYQSLNIFLCNVLSLFEFLERRAKCRLGFGLFKIISSYGNNLI